MVTTTTMLEYLFIVLLFLSGLNSIQSANTQKISATLNTNNNNKNNDNKDGSRKLPDNVEIITHTNLIVDDNRHSDNSPTNSKVAKPKYDVHDDMYGDEDAKEYQYFNDAAAVSTPKYDLSQLSPNYDLAKYESPKYESLQYEPAVNYDTSNFDTSNFEALNYEQPKYGPPLPPLLPSIKIPSNFQIDESDLTHSYYKQEFEQPLSYIPNDPLIGNRPLHTVPIPTADVLPIVPSTSLTHIAPISHQSIHSGPVHAGPNHIIRVTHEPIWAPEVKKLESQYLEAYRSIKSSVLSFYYKMHYFVNYFMNLFSFAEKTPYAVAQGRAGGLGGLGGGGGGGHGGGGGGAGKFRFKKKYRRFLLPLLLAYKLKFFTLIPLLIGGLVLLVGATGMAGFFFALFAAVLSLKGSAHE